eukprot:gene9894-2216_t
MRKKKNDERYDESEEEESLYESESLMKNKKYKEPSKIYNIIQTILFSYSFLVTIVLIIFISLFFWQLIKIPVPEDYEQKLFVFRRKTKVCRGVKEIQNEEYKERRRKLIEKLRNGMVDVMIMEPGPEMIYFTGIRWKLSERPFLFIMTKNEKEFFISPKFEQRKANETTNNMFSIYTYNEDESPYQKLKEYLEILMNNDKLNNITISISKETRLFIYENIKQLQNVNLSNEGNIMINKLRMIKSKNELNILRCANILTKAVHYQLFHSSYLKEGIKQSEFSIHVKKALEAVGLSNVWYLVLFGENAAFPHGTKNDLVLKQGDFILLDIGGSLFNYQSDISRTYSFKSNNEKIIKAWNLVQKSQEEALKSIKSGVKCSEIDKVSRKVIDDSEWGSGYKYYQHRLGHGIGIQGHEDPYFVGNSDIILEVGMTLSVEPGIYVDHQFGIRLEDIIVVTNDGYEVFGGLSTNLTNPVPIY